MNRVATTSRTVIVAAVLAVSGGFASAGAQPLSYSEPTYADLADLADSAPVVAHVQVRDAARVKDARAPGLQPGHGRFFVRAKTRALLTGTSPIGESLRYLVDLPLDAKGKPAKLAKAEVLIFASPAPRAGEVQLVAPDAQIAWTPAREAQVRTLLQDLLADGAPGRVTGVREVIHVPGTLSGEGETQMFLTTRDGSAASITVRHVPGGQPQWGASFSELIADVGNPPRADTLAWYRLACFLPNRLPSGANLSETASARAQAEADYRLVLGDLGRCDRNRD